MVSRHIVPIAVISAVVVAGSAYGIYNYRNGNFDKYIGGNKAGIAIADKAKNIKDYMNKDFSYDYDITLSNKSSKIDDIKFTGNINSNNGKQSMDFKYNDLSAKIILDKNAYIQIPDLSKEYMKLNQKSIKSETDKVLSNDNMISQVYDYNYDKVQKLVNDKELKNEDIIEDSIESVEYKYKVKSGKAKTKDIAEIVSNDSESFNINNSLDSSFQYNIDNLIENSEDEGNLTLYYKHNVIKGFEFDSKDLKVSVVSAYNKNSNAFSYSCNANDEHFNVIGNSDFKDSIINGKYTISGNEQKSSIELKEINTDSYSGKVVYTQSDNKSVNIEFGNNSIKVTSGDNSLVANIKKASIKNVEIPSKSYDIESQEEMKEFEKNADYEAFANKAYDSFEEIIEQYMGTQNQGVATTDDDVSMDSDQESVTLETK